MTSHLRSEEPLYLETVRDYAAGKSPGVQVAARSSRGL